MAKLTQQEIESGIITKATRITIDNNTVYYIIYEIEGNKYKLTFKEKFANINSLKNEIYNFLINVEKYKSPLEIDSNIYSNIEGLNSLEGNNVIKPK